MRMPIQPDISRIITDEGMRYQFDLQTKGRARQLAPRMIEALHAAGYVIVPVPEVGHKGPCDTDASALLQVAWNLDRDYSAGGSNVRRAVSELLRSVAHAATDDCRTTKERRRAGATA